MIAEKMIIHDHPPDVQRTDSGWDSGWGYGDGQGHGDGEGHGNGSGYRDGEMVVEGNGWKVLDEEAT